MGVSVIEINVDEEDVDAQAVLRTPRVQRHGSSHRRSGLLLRSRTLTMRQQSASTFSNTIPLRAGDLSRRPWGELRSPRLIGLSAVGYADSSPIDVEIDDFLADRSRLPPRADAPDAAKSSSRAGAPERSRRRQLTQGVCLVAWCHFFAGLPGQQRQKVWSHNPIERLNREVTRRADAGPNLHRPRQRHPTHRRGPARAYEEWTYGGRRYFPATSMRKLVHTIHGHVQPAPARVAPRRLTQLHHQRGLTPLNCCLARREDVVGQRPIGRFSTHFPADRIGYPCPLIAHHSASPPGISA